MRRHANPHGPSESTPGESLTVGSRVRTFRKQADSGDVQPGRIVERYDAPAAGSADYGRDWGHTKRWAIALDGGGLVFRDDHEVEPE